MPTCTGSWPTAGSAPAVCQVLKAKLYGGHNLVDLRPPQAQFPVVAEPDFDPDKEKRNVATHGISLARWIEIDVVAFAEDYRFDYGEQRFRAWGYIDGAAHCLAYTLRHGRVRPISLRRAHSREMSRHASQQD